MLVEGEGLVGVDEKDLVLDSVGVRLRVDV